MRPPSDPTSLAAEVLAAVKERGALLVLTDFDGTLSPIVEFPESARLPAGARRALARLVARPATRVAVVSGRDLTDLKGRVNVPDVILAGCHGLVAEGQGLSFEHPQADVYRDQFQQLGADLTEKLRSLRGVQVEAKALGVAVHYRRTPHSDLAEVFYQVQQARESAGPSLTTQAGKKVIEFLPNVAWHKGECALWLRDRLGQTLPAEPATVYLGDDETDERAFEALRGKGLTIRVGPGHRRSAALRWVKDVADVQAFLAALAAGTETR
jgi:trehalose-phosphatase